MAATWIKPRSAKGKTAAQTIKSSIDYAVNPNKTRNGELTAYYECSPRTASAEFLLSKEEYSDITGKEQKAKDVLVYHIRQSFKPGEIEPEAATKLGYELVLRLTKGRHAFVVATHEDKAHIHNHIIFNSTTLDSTRKFRNPIRSHKIVRRISDHICFENGLSIIENPKPSRGHYGTWLGERKEPSLREKLQQAIDDVLAQKPDDFGVFLKLMETAGYEIKQGKHTSFKGEGCQRFMRLRSLDNDYNEDAIRERIEGKRVVQPKEKAAPVHQPLADNLLMQIQRCVKPKGSPGYDRWAATFNLKQLVKTFEFLQENNLLEYEKLAEKAQQAMDDFNGISIRIKEIDARLPEISSLQKHIGAYSKTKDIFAEYRKSGWSKKFYAAHEKEIELNKAAKKAFDALGLEKLPSIKSLQTEYATLSAEKKSLYGRYKESRQYMQDILAVKQNAEQLLNYKDKTKTKENERT